MLWLLVVIFPPAVRNNSRILHISLKRTDGSVPSLLFFYNTLRSLFSFPFKVPCFPNRRKGCVPPGKRSTFFLPLLFPLLPVTANEGHAELVAPSPFPFPHLLCWLQKVSLPHLLSIRRAECSLASPPPLLLRNAVYYRGLKFAGF